jgi:hypothetical protein
MRLAFCVACGSTDDLQHHHLITRAMPTPLIVFLELR